MGVFMHLRSFLPTDYPAVAQIYWQGIKSGISTFETEPPTFEAFDQYFLPFCRFVAVASGTVAGWCVLSPVSKRACYTGVAEITLYVHQDFRRKGIGSLLLQKLLHESAAHGIWTLQATIFAKNEASIRLHLNAGFREVGYREKIAALNGIWHNTILFEKRIID